MTDETDIPSRPLTINNRRSNFRLTMRKREAIVGYIFLAPWLIGFLVFLVGPMLTSIYLSLTEYKMISGPIWIGLANYERMIADPLVIHSMTVTIKYTVLLFHLA